MKNRLKILFNSIAGCCLIMLSPVTINGKQPKPQDSTVSATARFSDLDSMDFIEMLNSVDVGKTSELIQKFQTKEGRLVCLMGSILQKVNVR